MKLQRGTHLSEERAEAIIHGAGRILAEIGIKVTDKNCLESLKGRNGITLEGDRAKISVQVWENFLEKQKQEKSLVDKHGQRLHGEASMYTYQYRNPEKGQIEKYTCETLAEQARFMEKARKHYALNPVVPGYPTDVPAQLSSLMRYKIAAENCSYSWPVAPDSVEAAAWMFEMTQVMGQEMKHLPVYMISPLTLGGDALQIVLENKDKLESFYTFAMPNIGVTTPMNLTMGMAMALAEVAGGAILVEMLTGLKGVIRPNLFPFDFRYFNVAFGTPEKFLYEQVSAELMAYIKEEEPDYSSTNIHTWGKEPDGRTGIEKGMMIMAGALYGAKRFYCIGTLSLDELFDPLQMLQDLEAITFAQQLLDGAPEDEMEETMMEEIREGLTGGFVSSDRSLDCFADYLRSGIFSPKNSFQKWKQEGEKSTRDGLLELYRKINSQNAEYELEKEKQRELDRIWKAAMSVHQKKDKYYF